MTVAGPTRGRISRWNGAGGTDSGLIGGQSGALARTPK